MKKELKAPQLKIYFKDMLLLDRIANVAEAMNTSMSTVGELLVKSGIENLEELTEKHIVHVHQLRARNAKTKSK